MQLYLMGRKVITDEFRSNEKVHHQMS